MNHCQLLNTTTDAHLPSDFTTSHHIHILVRKGEMRFSDGRNSFVSKKDDLVIWQMSNTIQEITYSADFEADFLIVTGEFLSQYNPEMVWASKGFVFIRTCPSFHLDDESLRLIKGDFDLFRSRQGSESPFRRDVLGRVLQIFLYDLWTVYQHGLAKMETSDRTAQLFLKFLGLVQSNVRTEREVAFYAEKAHLTTRHFSVIIKEVVGFSASDYIEQYLVTQAKSLLASRPDLSVQQISDHLGYADSSSFCRFFKRHTDIAPNDFRRQG